MTTVTEYTQVFDRTDGMCDVRMHYCPGCAHGIAHRLVAEAITELGLLEKTVGVCQVGCAVFAYDYFNCDMIQASHGRAPAVATGAKRCNPESIVFTYQGDGDLASIGMAEIVHAAARSENITVIFINNAVLALEWFKMPKLDGGKQIAIDESYLYNPELNYKTYMVPGILVLLVTIIGMLLSGINLVREKEIGTMEQINVTPIKKYQLIIGKMLPFLAIALFDLAFGLTIGFVFFHVPIVGSLPLLFGCAIVYLIVALGFGLLVSTLVDTQQQAMFIAFFFMMIFIMMSGLFTSIESMPQWGQYIDRLNPVAYFVRIIRMILLKGSSFRDIQTEFWSLVAYGFVVFIIAIKRYHKRA